MNIRKWFLVALLLFTGVLCAFDEEKWLGQILTDATVAKRYALENNRPLLVEVGHNNCDHCKFFINNVLITQRFIDFATENRLVLLSMQNKTNASNTYRAFQSELLYNGQTFPMLMMFHVKPEADIYSSALDKSQVELCLLTGDATITQKTGLKYPDTLTTILGVTMSPESSWNPNDCIALIEKFFPNNYWETLVPSQEDDYEEAIDLGRVWDDLHIPMKDGKYYDSDWTQRKNVPAQTGENPLFWFKFTGHQGVRYFFETQNPRLTGGNNLTFTAEMFASRDGKPIPPALGSVTSTNFDTLANGFWFDAPAGDAIDQLYYLRIQGTGGTADTSASFTLRYHEEPSNPEPGTLRNPLWTGAELGQWTMDLDAALAASRNDGKPVLLYFVAIHWCPHCLGWEHLAFSTEAFAERTAGYYLVVMDNRRRNGSGPALMTDNQVGGYRKTWGISDETATTKLAETRTIEVALSRGQSPTADYPTGRIGYPSFVVVRAINGDGPLYTGMDVVARVDDVWTGEKDVTNAFDQFDALYADGYAETQQYPEEANPNVFTTSGQTLTADLCPMASTWFARADIPSGKYWQFEVPAVVGTDATATLTVFDEDGATALATRSFTLADGAHILFAPGEDAPEFVWCRLTVDDLNVPIRLPVTATQKPITEAVSIATDELYVFRTANGFAQIPLRWMSLLDSPPDITLAYQVETEVAQDCVTVGTGTFAWPAEAGSTALLPIPVHVPADRADWEGTLDFTVTLLNPDNDKYLVVSPASIVVHITSTTIFPQESKVFLFSKGVYSEVRLPVCTKENPTISVAPLPKGMSYEWDVKTSSILLYGIPLENQSDVAATVTVEDVSHPFKWTVYDSGNRVLTVQTIGGYLTGNNGLSGSFYLTNQADGKVDVTLTTADGTRQGTANGWQNGSGEDTLVVVCTWDDGATLQLEANTDGTGTGVFTDGTGGTYSAVLYIPMEDATHFAGRYHVAYRAEDDVDGISRGWTILEVSEDGLVDFSVQMYDGTTVTGTAFLQPDVNEEMATLGLYVALGNGRYLGATLLLLAQEIVEDGEPAVLDSDYSTTWYNGEETQNLIATGVFYDASRAIAELAGENNFTFLVEISDADVPVFAPDILLQEVGDALVPSRDSLLSGLFQSFQINRADGTFQGSFRFLSGEGLLTEHQAAFRGILTPISPECCGITDAVASAYGYYTYEGRNYAIRVIPEAYSSSVPPDCTIVAQNGNNITWNVKASGQILCKRLLDSTYYGFVCKGASHDIVLDGTSPYDVVALNQFCVESETMHLGLQCGEEMTIYPSNDQRNKPGWVMIAIPWNLLLTENQAPNAICFTINTATNCLIRPAILESGRAYWLFTTDGNASLTFTAVTNPTRTASDFTLSNGWHMLAWDEAFASLLPQTYIWNGIAYGYEPHPQNNKPVMFYISK